MKMLIPAVGALTLTLALPSLAEVQDRGNGRGQERGGGEDRARTRPERPRDDDRSPGRGRDNADARRAPVRQAARAPDRDRGPAVQRPVDRREDRRDNDRRVLTPERRVEAVRRAGDRPGVVLFRPSPERGLIAGCPPGLARKNNGCLPPGQARRIARDYARYDYVWDRRDTYEYRYDEGYLYRYDPRGSLLGWMPALGGALGLGSVWPTQYRYEPAPTYYVSYYRLPDRYDYRYADGVLYGLDPQTQAISQVAALLTGEQWNVGQRMPAGYDIYNVPYGYRDRYYDTPDRWYRYNDGYVYQVDPTTQLVQAVIQMLT